MIFTVINNDNGVLIKKLDNLVREQIETLETLNESLQALHIALKEVRCHGAVASLKKPEFTEDVFCEACGRRISYGTFCSGCDPNSECNRMR